MVDTCVQMFDRLEAEADLSSDSSEDGRERPADGAAAAAEAAADADGVTDDHFGDMFFVEDVLAERSRPDGKTDYLILWKDAKRSESTWVCEYVHGSCTFGHGWGVQLA
jgi:hypothetical protein